MTNLIEKALIIGFGIFIASIFLSFTMPFLGKIISYDIYVEDDLNDYIKLIDDVDKGIKYIIENPNNIYQKEIFYPNNMNITIDNFYINFKYIIKEESSQITLKYNNTLKSYCFCEISPKYYLFIVCYELNLIKVEIF